MALTAGSAHERKIPLLTQARGLSEQLFQSSDVTDAQTAASADDLHAALELRLGMGCVVFRGYRHTEEADIADPSGGVGIDADRG